MKSTLLKSSLVSVFVFLGCSGSPLPFRELLDMDIFPEEVGRWQREGNPTSDMSHTRGYIHAVYCYGEDGLCCFKVWVIDKGSPQKADQWLEKLIAGTHTESSIRPLSGPLQGSFADVIEFHKGFSKTSEMIKGREAYERLDRSGGNVVSHNTYFTYGRFVVGGSNTPFPCPTSSAQQGRSRFWPLFEGLNLPE